MKRTAVTFVAILLSGAVAHAQIPDEDEAGLPASPEEPAPVTATAEAAVAVTEPAATAAEVGYDKGYVIAHDTEKGTFKLKISARVQTGIEAKSTVDDADQRANTAAFLVRRARLNLEGHAFTKKLGYKFQTDFGRGFVTLKDYYIDAEIADKVWLRAGQWKRFWNRQQIASSGKLELVDRAASDKEFRGGRDLGVAIHNNYEKSPETEWAIGVFNGTGEAPVLDPDKGTFSNVPADFFPVFLARAGINRGGLDGYSEADLEGGGLRWGVATSLWVEGDFDGGDPPSHQAQVDFIVKHDGLSAGGAFYLATREQDPVDGGVELDRMGAYAQIGMVFGEGTRRMNAVGRYNILLPQEDPSVDPTHEVTVGVGWFPYGHNAKLQAEVGSAIEPEAGIADAVTARIQGQLAF